MNFSVPNLVSLAKWGDERGDSGLVCEKGGNERELADELTHLVVQGSGVPENEALWRAEHILSIHAS